MFGAIKPRAGACAVTAGVGRSKRTRPAARLACVLGLLLVMPSAVRAATVPVENEVLTGAPTNVQISPPTCPAADPANFSFTASGTASGPYSGTFVATFTGTIGGPRAPGTGNTPSSDVIENETFTITSGDTTITGTAETVAPEFSPHPAQVMGVCDVFNTSTPDHGREFLAQVNVRYDVTVHAPEGDTSYSGVGFTNTFDDVFCSGAGTPEDTVPFFHQTLFTSDPGASASPPPGAGAPVQGGPITCPDRNVASVALTPADATNGVGTTHTVTARSTTSPGYPTSNTTVLFTVAGSVSTTGSCTTDDSGQCTFSYQGPQVAGSDTITACADENHSGTADAGEPCGTATKHWVAADADGDGVDDIIGTGSGGFRDVIADSPVATTGQVVSVDPGLTVRVQDAADPDGVLVTVGPGTGRVTLSLCGGFTMRIAAGSSAVLTCGSITVKTLTGSATVELANGITTVTVPATAVARVSNSGAGRFTVENQGAVAVTVTTSGVRSTVAAHTTTTVAVVTIANVCSLAKSYVQGSDRYHALTAKQKQTVDALATAACAFLQKITPKLTAKQKADLITSFKAATQALVPPGWLSQQHADTIKSLAGAL